MKITVIGATGMVGSRVVAEAAKRGHEVSALSRSGREVDGAAQFGVIDLVDTPAVVNAVENAEAAVVAVSPDRAGGSHEPTLRAHRDLVHARPGGRLLVVGGAGSLEVDGVLLKDAPDFPQVYRAEAETLTTVLELYRDSDGIDWTLISPAPLIAPGGRAGQYQVGSDSPVGPEISAEDFAVAIVDELEHPSHQGRRFTVAG